MRQMLDGTTCQVAYFGQKVIFSASDVSERFKESISRFPANFKKISESRIFDLSRDPTSLSSLQNMSRKQVYSLKDFVRKDSELNLSLIHI